MKRLILAITVLAMVFASCNKEDENRSEICGGNSGEVLTAYAVGDAYPNEDDTGIAGVVWSVNDADGDVNMTAGATGTSGSILALKDAPQRLTWATGDAYDADLHMDLLPNYLSDGKVCMAHITSIIAGEGAGSGKGWTKNYFPAYAHCLDKTDGEYRDWYLPAIDQLLKKSEGENLGVSIFGIYFEMRNRYPSPLAAEIGLIGGSGGNVIGAAPFVSDYYWSSSETSNSSHSWIVNFNNGYVLNYYTKSSGVYVRCVRDF